MNKFTAGTILINHGIGSINHHCVFAPKHFDSEVGDHVDAMCLTGVVGQYKENESIEDAKRIAACLNACAPFKTELLEKHGADTFDNSIIECQDRIELLLLAFKDAQSFISEINTVGGRYHGLTGLVVQDSYKEFQKIENVFNELKDKK